MVSIRWCLKVKKGVRLIEPSELKCADYLKRAEEDLKSMQQTKGHWKLITAYYACYDALYALLMKAGIKSEIHDCSIALMTFFSFNKEDVEFLKRLKDDRIQVQYYLKTIPLNQEDKVKLFVLGTKEKVGTLQEEDIKKIRNKILGFINDDKN